MNKIVYAIAVIFIIYSTLIIENCFAQWESDIRLTNAFGKSITSYNNAKSVAANGNIVHVVWSDKRNPNLPSAIFYKRSTDAGITWSADTLMYTLNYGFCEFPNIAVSGTFVHIIWVARFSLGNYHIAYRRSTDAGITWGPSILLGSNVPTRDYPSFAVSGTYLHVVWQDFSQGSDPEIYYKRSTDGGTTWEADTRITFNTNSSNFPCIAVSGSNVHVVWQDQRDGNWEIYYKGSTDGGINWGSDTRLTNNADASEFPTIAVFGSIAHVIWSDNRDGNWKLFHKSSLDYGITWGTDTRLTNLNTDSWRSSIAISGSNLHLVWTDFRDGNFNWEIYYKSSTNSGINWGADTRLSNDPDSSIYPSIAISGSNLHLIWSDNRDNDWEIYYKRNPTGNIGINVISTEIPVRFSLSQNYPNPFNPTTKIKFQIPLSRGMDATSERGVLTQLIIYDILGREVTTLVNEQLQHGTYEVDFDGSNLPSGVYFYELISGLFKEVRKMTLIR